MSIVLSGCVLWYHVQFESNFVASLVSLFQALSPVFIYPDGTSQ